MGTTYCAVGSGEHNFTQLNKNFLRMKKVFFMAALFAVTGVVAEASAQIIGDAIINRGGDTEHHKPHRSPNPNKTPQVSYNSASTLLSVMFPTISQGGKVEIYRNGAKVVNVVAPAGASLSYVLHNYGKGEYTVIVSQGNTMVYNRTMKVR